MEEKLRFVFDYERDEHSMVELCARYGICRDTGYEWLRRFRLHGVKGLTELNRDARQLPKQRRVDGGEFFTSHTSPLPNFAIEKPLGADSGKGAPKSAARKAITPLLHCTRLAIPNDAPYYPH